MKHLVLVFFLLFPSLVHAQAVEAIPPGDDVIEPVQKGSPAPFSGQLFDTMTAMRWGNYLQQYRLRLDVDVKAAEKTCKAELDYDLKIRDIETDRNKKVETDLQQRLLRSEQRNAALQEKLNNPSFFRSMEFGVTLGVVSSVVVAVVTALTVK
jgi:hypothetical protein